jgi:two-component system sensor histidine kinase HydH
MSERFGSRWQILVVVVLFAASLIALLSSSLAAFALPRREVEMQKQLTDASGRMAALAAALLDKDDASPRKMTYEQWDRQLIALSAEVLDGFDGVEGGYYLADWGRFAGYAFPHDPHAPPEPPPLLAPKHPPGKKGKKHPPPPPEPSSPLRRNPPSKEGSSILALCQASLNGEAGAQPNVQILDIPPSRSMVVTEGVGPQRPARIATWVMTRLTRPEHLAADLRRYLTSAILALAGILVSLLLTLNLGRNLRRERQQREQLGEELRRAEHFAALGKLLAGVAHEVRNPLAAIRSTVQLYQRLPPQGRDPSALDAVLHGVDRLNALVSRLLLFVRSGHEERRLVALNAVVEEMLTLVRAQADVQKVVLRSELASNLSQVRGSAQALQQVVLNLATNALQAMPNGGTLLCRTRRLEGPPRIELCVADSGPGVAVEELPHLFEPFHTTRPEGTGLGLAMCREIVHQHGGQIELDHQAGWGAVFRVTLPIG